jgi:hypothetical protein
LRLAGNDLNDSDIAALARALGTNTCPLRHLDLSANGIDKNDLESLASALGTNDTLTSLNLKYNMFLDFPPSWFELMMTRNYSLEQIEHSCKAKCWWMAYACRLNQGGRRLLRRRRRRRRQDDNDNDNDVPTGLWPVVLERSSNSNVDAIFYLVRHGPMLREGRC